jgi:hypothetical protein
MKKLLIPALCLCLLFCMSITAFANTGELIDVTGETGGGGGTSEPPPEPEPQPEPEPEAEAKYTITIAAPKGWHTKSASVTVKLEDVNGTGFEKAEAKLGSNGAWQDISDALRSYGQAQIEITDNGTVYVAVTDKKGKAHVKSLYIECFDREPPTVRARIDGRSLRAETDDALSGAEYVYVNGYSFDDLVNGTLDIRVREYVDGDEEEIFVYAVDYAGNRSKTVTVKNPYYEPPRSSAPASAPPASSAPAAPTPQAPASQAPAAPVVSAPAASQPPASAPAPAAPPKQEAEQSDADRDSVTPTDGTGTVIENSNKTPGQREFFTISTEAGNDFYIVVDKQKADENVYLLSAVTEDDLMGLAEPSDNAPAAELPPVEPLPEPEPEPAPAPEPEPTPAPEPEPEPEPAPKEQSDAGMYVIILILALAFGGGLYYFKIVKPKKDAPYPDDEDEDMDMEMEDDEPDYPDDDYYYPESEYAGAEDSGQRAESGAADA